MEFEHETPRALSSGNAGLFFFRVRDALAQVDGDYDVVVIDCPPQLGFLTMSALSAATGVALPLIRFCLNLCGAAEAFGL